MVGVEERGGGSRGACQSDRRRDEGKKCKHRAPHSCFNEHHGGFVVSPVAGLVNGRSNTPEGQRKDEPLVTV